MHVTYKKLKNYFPQDYVAVFMFNYRDDFAGDQSTLGDPCLASAD